MNVSRSTEIELNTMQTFLNNVATITAATITISVLNGSSGKIPIDIRL